MGVHKVAWSALSGLRQHVVTLNVRCYRGSAPISSLALEPALNLHCNAVGQPDAGRFWQVQACQGQQLLPDRRMAGRAAAVATADLDAGSTAHELQRAQQVSCLVAHQGSHPAW